MYIYKVTHLPTRQFYIGISVESKDSFDPIRNPDPAGKFRIQGSNGISKITNIENVIVRICHSMEELVSESTKLIKSYETNENFLSLQLHEDGKVVVSDAVREVMEEESMTLPSYSTEPPKKRVFDISEAVTDANKDGKKNRQSNKQSDNDK